MDSEFCTACGAKVNESDLFCPACGIPVAGRPADQAYQEMYLEASKSRVTWAGVMLLIATIPSLIMGIYMIIDASAAAQTMIDTYDWISVDASSLSDLIKDYGILVLAIGALGVVGSALCFMHRHWWFVLLMTIAVLFMGVTTFFGIFLGFLALWFVMSSRAGFMEYQ